MGGAESVRALVFFEQSVGGNEACASQEHVITAGSLNAHRLEEFISQFLFRTGGLLEC